MFLRTISASSLTTFSECPARYYAENVQYAPRSGNTDAADLGTAVHACLERYVKGVKMDGTIEEGLDNLLAPWDEEFEKAFDSVDHDTSWYKEGQELLERWYNRTELDGFEVLQVEKKMSIPIKTSQGEKKYNFIWDRCDEFYDGDSRVIRITDYKGLDVETPIPTPSGWSKMKNLTEGDQVIDGRGIPCSVLHKSETHYRDCYELAFDDGSKIICDDEHRWEVELLKQKRVEVLTVQEILDGNLLLKDKQGNLAVDVPPVELPHASLPVDPYVLGVWIGGGHSCSTSVSSSLPELFDEVEHRGYEVTAPNSSTPTRRTIRGLVKHLVEMNLIQNKHIPMEYMRASFEQRLDLLRGIMDTDGHWNSAQQRVVLNTASKLYADQVRELVISLGWTAGTVAATADGPGKKWDAWRTWFTPSGEDVFIARPPEDYRPGSGGRLRRIIKSINKVETVPTQCIEVDSPAHTFLAGENMVKTHNTIRNNISPEQLKVKIQARMYAMSAAMIFKENPPDEVWVCFDLLRYSPVEVHFSREENVETWKYIKRMAEKVIAEPEDRPTEKLGPGCAWCVRKSTCKTLAKNANAGGITSLRGDQMLERYLELQSQQKGIRNALDEISEHIFEKAQELDEFEWEDGDYSVRLTSRKTRTIDSEEVVRIIGPELAAQIGKVSISEVDKLLKTGELTDSQASLLRGSIKNKFSDPKPKVEKIGLE